MIKIGSSHGINFKFDEGTLSAIDISKHRKRTFLIKEQFEPNSSLSISSINKPYPDVSAQYYGDQTQDYIPDTSTLLKTVQTLGIGQRHIEVCQYRKPDKSVQTGQKQFGLVIASLSFQFDLTQTSLWLLVLPNIDSILEKQKSQLQIQIQDNVILELNSTEIIKFKLETFGSRRNARIEVLLPKGMSRIQLKVNSTPNFDISDTLVICRPNQLREAAIIMSCLPSNHFTPLIILEQPPITEEEYVSLYREYMQFLRKTTELIGGTLGRSELAKRPENIREFFKIVAERTRLQDELTPFRSWIKRNQMLSYILSDISIKQVIFLFQPRKNDLQILSQGSMSHSESDDIPQEEDGDRLQQERRFPLLPEDIRHIYFVPEQEELSEDSLASESDCYYFKSLPELTELAWKRLGPTGNLPDQAFDIPEESEAHYLIGLFCALRDKVPLRPINAIAPSLDEACQIANDGMNADEVVLIENTGDASTIIGVLYAHYQKARLIVAPQPDLSSVEKAIVSYQQKQEQTLKALKYVLQFIKHVDEIPELSDIEKSKLQSLVKEELVLDTEVTEFKRLEFLNAIRQYLFSDWRTIALTEIEAAVSQQIPDYVLSAVGEHRLTAFTTGLPYSFVKKNGIDWSQKAIGHVVSDAPLIVLSEVYGKGAMRSPITFNLIFDPGFFQTAETDDVLQVLEQHFTHSILLSEKNASFLSLMQLPQLLPLEIVFFNTHGSDNAIIFGDAPLMKNNIPQWLTLSSRPVVFNNSCLSWIGVGREFIRVGARGYIGTLWSINAKAAADFARIVMQKLVRDGASISEAICKTGVDPFTERAYIYVGTVNARLDEWRDQTLKEDKAYFLGALDILFDTLAEVTWVPGETRMELDKILYNETQYFTKRLQEVSLGSTLDVIDTFIKEISILSEKVGRLNKDPDYEDKLISSCLAKLDALSIPENMKSERYAQIYFLSGLIQWQRGRLNEAIANLKQSIEHSESAGASVGSQYQQMSEVFKQMGQWEQAKEASLRAKEFYEKEGNELGILFVLGQLGQLSKRLSDYNEGMQYATEGFEKAVKLDNRSEQAIFLADQAQLYLALEDYDKAIEAALESARISRTIFDDLSEVKVYGIIGRCYTEKGELDLAEDYITRGLEQARNINDPREVASFLFDLGELKSLRGDVRAGMDCYRHSAEIFAKHEDFERLIAIFGAMIDLNIRTGDWSELFQTMATLILICKDLDRILQGLIVAEIINNVKEVVNIAELQFTHPGLVLLWQITTKIIESDKGRASDQIMFLADTIGMILLWLDGQNKEAIERARILDRVSNNTMKLEAFVTSPYAK